MLHIGVKHLVERISNGIFTLVEHDKVVSLFHPNERGFPIILGNPTQPFLNFADQRDVQGGYSLRV